MGFTKVEIDTASLTDFKTNADSSFSVAEELLDYTNKMYDAAKAHYDHWVASKNSYIKKHKASVSQSDDKYNKRNSLNGEITFNSFLFNKDSLAAQSAAESWVTNYMQIYSSNLSNFKQDVETVKSNIEKMKNCAQKLTDAVTEFDSQAITASRLEKAREDLIKLSNEAGRYGVDIATEGLESLSYQGSEDGVDAMVTGEDGESKRATDGIKQGYDFTTTTVNTATAVAALGDRRGWTPEEIGAVQRRQIDYNYRSSQRNYEAGYYDTGGNTSAKAREIYESVFNEPYTPSNVQNRLNELRQSSGLTPDEIDFIGAYIGGGTGAGNIAPVSSVLLSVDKALDPSYSPFAGDVRNPSQTPVPAPTGGCGGHGGGGGHTPAALVGHTSPSAIAGNIATPVATPTAANITRIAEQSIPAPIKTDSAKTIDQQASDIFYGKNPDQVAADRANALSIVDKAFSGEGVEDFKEVLKQGGFDDVDISIIMDNKEIAVTAYILATESQSLTGIANQLATANGIVGFDTMYDNGLSRMSLENGLSQSKLMAEVNEEVQDARTNLQNARNRYNSSVKKANESIDEANDKKEKMEDLKKRIIKKSGEDPSKWDDEDVEAYNKAIEEYNDANKAANEAHQEAIQNKELMDQAETDFNETHDRVANEYLKQHQDAQAAAKEMAEGDGSTSQELNVHEGVEVEKVTNDPNSLSTDDIVTDSEGNVEVQKTEVTTETPNEDTFVSPGEESTVEIKGTSGGNVSTDNVEGERKLTTDDLMELFNDIEDVANVSSEQRTLDAVDLSSLSAEDRTLPNLGLGSDSPEVVNTSSNDNMVSPTEVTNELAEDRIIPELDLNNSFENINNVNEVKAINIPGVETSGLPDSNSLVGFADKAASDAQEKTNDFQNNKFNGMGGMSMNMSGLETETTYASKVSENKKDDNEVKSSPEAPTEEKETKNVAGVQVEAVEDERHTDGVLIDSGDKVASEVSEDGRSLEYVEVE